MGEPDFKTPWAIRDAAIRTLQQGRTRYTANAGMKELRVEICNYLARRFGLHYSPDDQVLVTVGGSEAIDMAIRAMVQPGDEVIIPEPCFVCYEPITSLTGGVPVHIATRPEDQFRLKPEQLKNAITPRTKLLILPYPNNPTGAVMEREDLEAIAEVLRRHRCDGPVGRDLLRADLRPAAPHQHRLTARVWPSAPSWSTAFPNPTP